MKSRYATPSNILSKKKLSRTKAERAVASRSRKEGEKFGLAGAKLLQSSILRILEDRLVDVFTECDELVAIFVKSVETAKANQVGNGTAEYRTLNVEFRSGFAPLK